MYFCSFISLKSFNIFLFRIYYLFFEIFIINAVRIKENLVEPIFY